MSSKLYLSSDSGMVLWLSARGRILRRDRIEGDIEHKNILDRALREMAVLQSVVSIPIMYDGKLLSILNLDSKITGEPYGSSELEKVFVLSNYFGKAIQDIGNIIRSAIRRSIYRRYWRGWGAELSQLMTGKR